MTPSSIGQYTINTHIYKQPLSLWIYNDLIGIRIINIKKRSANLIQKYMYVKLRFDQIVKKLIDK